MSIEKVYNIDFIYKVAIDSKSIKDDDIFELNTDIYSYEYLSLMLIFLKISDLKVDVIENDKGKIIKIIKKQ